MMILDPGSSRGIVPSARSNAPLGIRSSSRHSGQAGPKQVRSSAPALGQQDQHRSSGQRGKEEGLSVGQRLQVQNDPHQGNDVTSVDVREDESVGMTAHGAGDVGKAFS